MTLQLTKNQFLQLQKLIQHYMTEEKAIDPDLADLYIKLSDALAHAA